jgi:hypothetical protein
VQRGEHFFEQERAGWTEGEELLSSKREGPQGSICYINSDGDTNYMEDLLKVCSCKKILKKCKQDPTTKYKEAIST